MGWYYYLQDTMQFPFTATCINGDAVLTEKARPVEVVGMAPEDAR